jgi:hypothetical protein
MTDDDAARLLDDAFTETACNAATLLDPTVLHHPHVFDGQVVPVHIELKVIPTEDLPIESIPSIVALISPVVSAAIEGCVEDITEDSFTCPVVISSPHTPDNMLRLKVRVTFGVHEKPTDDWALNVGVIIGYIIDSTFMEFKRDAIHTIEHLTAGASIMTIDALQPIVEELHSHLASVTAILARLGGMTDPEMSRFSDAAFALLRTNDAVGTALNDLPMRVSQMNREWLDDKRVHHDE